MAKLEGFLSSDRTKPQAVKRTGGRYISAHLREGNVHSQGGAEVDVTLWEGGQIRIEESTVNGRTTRDELRACGGRTPFRDCEACPRQGEKAEATLAACIRPAGKRYPEVYFICKACAEKATLKGGNFSCSLGELLSSRPLADSNTL